MWYRLSIAASAILIMGGGVAANAAELPTYEVKGFPASPAQTAILGAAGAQERAPAAPELAGMPASPVQIAVLKRHDQKFTENNGRPTTGLAHLSPAVATEQSR
jgi:hypothetical protein